MEDFILNTAGIKFDGQIIPPKINLEKIVDTKVDHPKHYTQNKMETIDVIENSTDNLRIFGLIEKNKNKKKIFNYKVVGTEDKLKKFLKKIKYALVAFGHIKNLDKRKKVFQRLR